MQREGSAFSGLGVVMLKELSDHLTCGAHARAWNGSWCW